MAKNVGRGSSWGDMGEGEDAQFRPAHGTVGPAKRAHPCDGACWTPNKFGLCKVCAGTEPKVLPKPEDAE